MKVDLLHKRSGGKQMKWKVTLIVLLLFVLAGCGGKPKADVVIFLMPSNGTTSEVADKLQADLQSKLGGMPTIQLVTTPIYSMEKLFVEIAAGENGIFIVPFNDFKNISQQGGYVNLDNIAKREDFPEGVLELPVEGGKKETHLFGIPLEKTKWFTDTKLNGKDLVAFVPVNAKNQDKVMQVLGVIAQK
jgi:predicted small lipoprotein YifL